MHAPTTISEVVRLIAEVLERHYRIDPDPLLARAGIDRNRMELSGGRIPRKSVMHLWELAESATGDPTIGLQVGLSIRPTSFYALSIAFISSDTLEDALEFLAHYYRVIVTIPLELHLVSEGGDRSAFTISYSDPHFPLLQVPFDSFIGSIVAMCRLADSKEFSPLEVRLGFSDNGRAEAYRTAFDAPIVFDADVSALVFARDDLERRLPGHSREMFLTADGVLQRYVAALDPDQFSARVRRELITMLPRGRANQAEVSKRLNMSASTLQRRLREENTSFRELLESTQQVLAIEYLRERRHQLAHIAFMLGFSEQSNFSRAFRRWTGVSPKTFRERAQPP